MAFKKGQSGNPAGRKPGQVNKFTTLKQAFLDAFEKTGGTEGLAKWIVKSERNRATFYQLVTKLFPQEVAHSGPGSLGEILLKVIHTQAGDKGNGNGGNGGTAGGAEG